MLTFLKKTGAFTWVVATLFATFLLVSCGSTETKEETTTEEVQPAPLETADTSKIPVDTTKTDSMPIVPRPPQ